MKEPKSSFQLPWHRKKSFEDLPDIICLAEFEKYENNGYRWKDEFLVDDTDRSGKNWDYMTTTEK